MKKNVRLGLSLVALVILFVLLAFWSASLRAKQPIEVGSDDDGAAESALNAEGDSGDNPTNDFSKNAKATAAVLILTMTPVPFDGSPTPAS